MARRSGLPRGAEQQRQRHQVEGGVARAMGKAALARRRIARDKPVERPRHRLIAALAADVGDHWPVRDMVEPLATEAAEQLALVRLAQERLATRSIGHRRARLLRKPARAIADRKSRVSGKSV